MALVKTNVPGFYKDPDTNAVINNSTDDYEAFKSQRNKIRDYDNLKNKVNHIENELSDIKSLLLQIVNGNKNG